MPRSTNTILASVAVGLPMFFVNFNEVPKGMQILWMLTVVGVLLAGLALWSYDRK